MPIDFSQIPDAIEPVPKGIDFSNIPDAVSIDFSKIPDAQPTLSQEEKLTTEPSFLQDVVVQTGKDIGKNLIGAGETALSLASGSATYPFAKIAGLAALPFGGKKAREVEEEVNKRFAYQPVTKSAQDATVIVGKALDTVLYPAKKAGEALEPFSPRASYLAETAGEIATFSMLPKIKASLKPKTKAIINKARNKGADVIELIRKRRGEIDVGILDSEFFIKNVERKLTKKELEAMPFIRQGIKNPKVLEKIGREDLIPIINKPSKNLKEQTKKVGDYYDKSFDFLKEHGQDINFIEDYVTQIWDIPKNKRSDVVNYFSTYNPFAKKRTIPTLEEGIKLGLKPKTTDIGEMLRVYDQYKVKTVHNKIFAEDLKSMVDESGNPLIMSSRQAPVDWVSIDHPVLNKSVYGGKLKDGKGIILRPEAAKVHPDIAKEVKLIFDKPFDNKAIRALETVNAFTKKSMLSVSLFHHMALTESALSTGIGKKAFSLWNPKKIVSELKSGNYGVFQNMPLAKDAIRSGVNFGALSDVQKAKVQKALISVEKSTKNIPGLKYITKGLRKGNDLWDASLWDYYHNTLKLYAYEHNVQQGLKTGSKQVQKKLGRDLTPKETTAIKREMAGFVNDSFGGQNWEINKVLGNPKTRQLMHWALLAPDWTVSTLKQAAAPIRGAVLQKTAKDQPTLSKQINQKLRGKALTKQGTKFWLKAAFYFNVIAQSLNNLNTKKEYGEGRFTWDNPPGKKLDIFIGKNEDGTERYLRMGKQFKEVLEFGEDPLKKMGGKLSPVVRESVRQFAKHDPGSGFPTEFSEQDFFESIPERVKSIAELPLPFSLRPYVTSRPGNYMFAFPTSKGMTNYKARQLFRKAIKKGNLKDIQKIFVHASENELDAEQLFKSANASIKADMTYDNTNLARDILKEIDSLKTAQEKRDALEVYSSRGILNKEVEKQMEKLLKKKARVGKIKSQLQQSRKE